MTRCTNLNEILRKDAMLNPKSLGRRTVVTTVADVEEDQIESYLDIISESNANVKFKKVQYSPTDLKLYFYANKEVDLSEIKERLAKGVVSKSTTKILYELSKLTYEKNEVDSESYISLYELAPVLFSTKTEYENKVTCISNQIKKNLPMHFEKDSSIVLYDTTRNPNELEIGIGKLLSGNVERIRFSKRGGDLHWIEPSSYWAKDLFQDNYKSLNELYEVCEEFDWFVNLKVKTKVYNSELIADLSRVAVSINGGPQRFIDYPITIHNFFNIKSDPYNVNSNSYELLNAVKGKEEIMFKNAYIPLSVLPEQLLSRINEYRKQSQEAESTETTAEVCQSVE